MPPPAIALQLYTLRRQAEADLPGTLREVARIGYGHVELAGLYGSPPERVRGWLDEFGLGAAAAHVPLERFEADCDAVISELSTLGCGYAVVPSLPRRLQTPGQHSDVARSFAGWAARLAGSGLGFAYHNHDFELRTRDERGATLLELLLEATDPKLVRLELDVYWAHAGGGDPVALLERYGDRIRLLHVKDVGPDGRDAPFGEGSLRWDELLPAAARAGVEWYVVEQDEPGDPLRDVETALRNLRSRS